MNPRRLVMRPPTVMRALPAQRDRLLSDCDNRNLQWAFDQRQQCESVFTKCYQHSSYYRQNTFACTALTATMADGDVKPDVKPNVGSGDVLSLVIRDAQGAHISCTINIGNFSAQGQGPAS